VLAAAEQAFAEHGLGVALDEIAARAGVGAGTVHRHFPTKAALIEAVLLERAQRLIDAARAGAQAERPGEAFFAFLERMVQAGAMHQGLKDALAGAQIETLFAERRQELRRELGQLLARAQEARAVRAGIAVEDVMALVAGAYHRSSEGGSPAAVMAVICDGLRPPDPLRSHPSP
jgi:AcrR family transcriptional regulator